MAEAAIIISCLVVFALCRPITIICRVKKSLSVFSAIGKSCVNHLVRRRPDGWNVQRLPHRMGRPLMEPLIWNATSGKPFGRSRLKRSIRTLIDDYIRTVANATIALEFDTTPQKYIPVSYTHLFQMRLFLDAVQTKRKS